MNFIDVHCHLNNKDYGDLGLLIEQLRTCGVKKVISAGFDLSSSLDALACAEVYPEVYFTAGLHPTELKNCKESDLLAVERLISHPKCVAVGEIGLDYHYDDTDKQKQYEFFTAQIEIAHRNNMPVVIHSRDCAEDMLELLKKYSDKLSSGALLHCYSHSLEMALIFEKMGLKFSFGGTSTYSGSKKARKTILNLSENSLLTETDSPYLSPKSVKGTFPNTPLSIPEILENMAQIRGVDVAKMGEIVWNNAHALFPKLNN